MPTEKKCKNCLLTYVMDGVKKYKWFEDTCDLEEYVRVQMRKHKSKFKVTDAIEINSFTNICLL